MSVSNDNSVVRLASEVLSEVSKKVIGDSAGTIAQHGTLNTLDKEGKEVKPVELDKGFLTAINNLRVEHGEEIPGQRVDTVAG